MILRLATPSSRAAHGVDRRWRCMALPEFGMTCGQALMPTCDSESLQAEGRLNWQGRQGSR